MIRRSLTLRAKKLFAAKALFPSCIFYVVTGGQQCPTENCFTPQVWLMLQKLTLKPPILEIHPVQTWVCIAEHLPCAS